MGITGQDMVAESGMTESGEMCRPLRLRNENSSSLIKFFSRSVAGAGLWKVSSLCSSMPQSWRAILCHCSSCRRHSRQR